MSQQPEMLYGTVSGIHYSSGSITLLAVFRPVSQSASSHLRGREKHDHAFKAMSLLAAHSFMLTSRQRKPLDRISVLGALSLQRVMIFLRLQI